MISGADKGVLTQHLKILINKPSLADLCSGSAVLQMVGNNVGDDLDAVLVQLGGSRLKFFSSTESVTDGKVGGLVEGPPVSRVGTVVDGRLEK